MAIASPPNAAWSCYVGTGVPDGNNGRVNGVLTAPQGGSVINLELDALVADSECSIEVDVTSATLGTHVNPAVTLFSSAGTAVSNSATLTVAAPGPVFSKSFSPATTVFGGRSRLTFSIDNGGGNNVTSMSFSDNLPAGMLIANPAHLTSTCPANAGTTLTAVADSDVVSYNAFSLFEFAGGSCEIAVDVIAGATGVLTNTSEELLTNFGPGPVSSGRAVASLTVSGGLIELTQAFTGDPINAGGTVDLVYMVQNTDRANTATDITFTNDLNASLSGLTLDATVPVDPCGPGSSISGAGTTGFALQNGSLDPESSCEFVLSLQVPAGAASGAYANTTSTVSATINTEQVSGGAAFDTLFVAPVPVLTKTFLQSTVAVGGTIDLEFSITNSSATATATDLAFVDELTTFLPFPVSVTIPATTCGTLTLVSLGTERQGLSLTGGSLVPSASCAFVVQLGIPLGLASGNYVNTTGEITATIGGETVAGPAATDSFAVVAPPTLAKEFTDDPVAPGGLVTLAFTLTHDESAPGDATAITFTDDLSTAVVGIAAVGLPVTDICGIGSQLSGTTTLTMSGGSLAAGESCSFSVSVNVPAGTASGTYENSTSAVQALVLGQPLSGQAASADLTVGGLTLTKAFDPIESLPGSSVDATYTIANISEDDATEIVFTDNLGDTLNGLLATAGLLPLNDICGTGSSLSLIGGDVLLFDQGSTAVLAAGTSCSFSASLDIPATALSGTYAGATSQLVGLVAGDQFVGNPAAAELTVNSDLLALSKEFIGDPVRPGENATLRFTMTNLSSLSIDNIAFTDNLDAALNNLIAVGLPLAACGGSASTLTGAVIDFAGGSLAASANCSFDVQVSVDQFTPLGSVAFNETSTISGMVNGSLNLPVQGGAATDEMQVHFIQFSKVFGGDQTAFKGSTAELYFTLANTSVNEELSDLSFSDDLDQMLPGAAALGLPLNDVCGPGSQISGTGLVSLQNGSLLRGGSCTFAIDVQIPATALEDTYENITSELLWAGVASADAASALLTIVPNPQLLLNSQKDTFLRAGNVQRNEGGNSLMRVRTSGKNRSLVSFDIPTGLPMEDLVSATLILNVAEATNLGNSGGRELTVFRALEPWAEGNGINMDANAATRTRGTGSGATWKCAVDTDIANQKADCAVKWNGGNFAAATAPPVIIGNGETGDHFWDVTADVLAGAENGWFFTKVTEGQPGVVKVHTREGAAALGNPDLQPRLLLEFE